MIVKAPSLFQITFCWLGKGSTLDDPELRFCREKKKLSSNIDLKYSLMWEHLVPVLFSSLCVGLHIAVKYFLHSVRWLPLEERPKCPLIMNSTTHTTLCQWFILIFVVVVVEYVVRLKLSTCTVRAPVFDRHQFFGNSEHYEKAHGSLLSGWMNYNYAACCWFPTSSNILILPSQFWQIRFKSYWLHQSVQSVEYWCAYGIWNSLDALYLNYCSGVDLPVFSFMGRRG